MSSHGLEIPLHGPSKLSAALADMSPKIMMLVPAATNVFGIPGALFDYGTIPNNNIVTDNVKIYLDIDLKPSNGKNRSAMWRKLQLSRNLGKT